MLFDWLISLRFKPEDAQGYTAALVSLGFDDLQSLREVGHAWVDRSLEWKNLTHNG